MAVTLLNPGCDDCYSCIQVLLWDASRPAGTTSLAAAKTVYDGLGITAHLPAQFTGDIRDYSLIVMLYPESDPAWLPDLAIWGGRMFLAGDYQRVAPPPFGFPTANAWINGLLATYGVGISINGTVAPGTLYGRSVVNDLTSTQAVLWGDLYSTVSGHTALYATGADVVMRRRTLSGVDWVVHGDGTSLLTAGNVALNANFLQALATAP